MNKLYLVNDYLTPEGELPNGINFDYFDSYVETQFSKYGSTIDLLQKKYYDSVGVWKGEGSFSYAVDGEVCTYDILVGEYDRDATYLYTISPFGGASCTYGLFASLHHGRSFYFFIPEKTKDLIRTIENFYLFINYSNEGTMDVSFFEVIYRDAAMFNIPTDKIIFCISDYNLQKTHDIWFNAFLKRHYNKDKDIKPIKLLYHMWSLKDKATEFTQILDNQKTRFGKYNNDCTVVSDKEVTDKIIRQKKFLMLNRRTRPHRLYSILLFDHLDILDDFFVSYDFINMKMFDMDREMFVNYHLGTEIDYSFMKACYDKVISTKPINTLDYDDLENVWGFNFEDKRIYLQSYIHITSETNFFEKGGYFSEKTWKPMGHLQPFIFMGPANGLSEIKKLGFKTFEPFINESYDSEENHAKRFKMIIDEIERLSKLSIEEIHNWYHSIFEDVLVYNQKLFLSYNNVDLMKNLFRENLKKVIYDNT